MHHSAVRVNARDLRCSVRLRGELGPTMVRAPCVTRDVIIRLHQARRCCSQFGCSGYPNDAAGTTEKRSDEGKCHNRPFAELAYSQGWNTALYQLHAGNDITVIALWLGHESVTTTQIYLQADMALKQRALDRTTPLSSTPGRYKPPDQLLAFLEAL
jgi:hypothetical protein